MTQNMTQNMTQHMAYIGLGANLGDAASQVQHALAALGKLPSSQLLRSSALYRSAPIDSSGADYVNAVAELRTSLGALELLHALQAQELSAGRERPFHNAPRTLDLDLLMFDEASFDTPALTLPHPRMHERAFVLAPLAELAPELVIPLRGTVSELLARVQSQVCVKIGA